MTLNIGLRTALAGFVLIFISGCMSPQGATIAAKRQDARQMRSDTLAKLYQIHPQARQQIASAEGYGVFTNVCINLILLSAGNGWGVVRDNKSGKDIYMKMVSAGIGIGLGVKDFRGVFVFTSKEALRRFTEHGWDASAQADAAAKAGSWRGPSSVARSCCRVSIASGRACTGGCCGALVASPAPREVAWCSWRASVRRREVPCRLDPNPTVSATACCARCWCSCWSPATPTESLPTGSPTATRRTGRRTAGRPSLCCSSGAS